jgi:PAS domain S-box-containing protein
MLRRRRSRVRTHSRDSSASTSQKNRSFRYARTGANSGSRGSDRARLAAIVESTEDAIISEDLDGTITSWNEGAARLFGYAAEDIVGQSVRRLIPPERQEEEDGILAMVSRGERIEHCESVRIARDGRRLDVSLTISPIRSKAGHIVGVSTIVRDVTARKRMEGELEQSRARLKAILDTSVDAIISIDERGIIQSVNPATQRMFGYSAAELVGQDVKILMPLPLQAEHDEHMARQRQTGERRLFGVAREIEARRKDGTVFAIDMAVSEVEPGKLFTSSIHDISERKSTEQRLRQADRMASIGTLAAGLGHDMNNVLLPMKARLNAMAAAGEAGCISLTDRKHIEEVRKSVAYLQQLADGLHYLAMDPDAPEDVRAGGGSGRATIELGQWWGQVGTLLSNAVPKHVRVSAFFPPNLPHVALAAHGLTQAVLNLVVNAGEAIPSPTEREHPQGYVRLWAEAKEDAGGSWVRLSVTDNGSGMTEEVKRRAFDMFFTTKARGVGTGLGLPLVRRVVERAGGRAEIESEIGKGTTIVLTMPAVRCGERAAMDEPGAVISVRNGRAAALIRHVLEVSGTAVRADDDPALAQIWIVDSALIELELARDWRQGHPRGQLVLFGRPEGPSAASWKTLRPVTIENTDDFESVRAALCCAMANQAGVATP